MKLRRPKLTEFEHYKILETEFYSHHVQYNTLLQDKSPFLRKLKKEFFSLMSERNFFCFICKDTEVAGYIYGKIKRISANEKGWKRIGELNSMVIAKKFRRDGLAKYAANEFFRWLKYKKIDYVEASCNVKNTQAIKFSTSLGLEKQHIKFGKILK